MNEKVVIVGSGLGGLQCGYILAKQGFQVTVLEKEHQTGGCLQTFMRGSQRFDTGLHYVGGLNEGGSLRPLFDYFDLTDLPWKQLDKDCFDEVNIGRRRFCFAQGHAHFVETLAADFPHERENLQNYTEMLRQVGLHIWDSLEEHDVDDFYSTSLFARSAYDWLTTTIQDPLLRNVLSGTSLKMELARERTPLYVFAQINNSFIQSAWRLQGGGQLVADRLTERITAFGGQVRTRAEVTQLIEKEGRIVEVEINGEERLPADWVISDAHPAVTLGLVKESTVLRNIYRRRITGLRNSMGMFTVNIRLKDNSLPYLNRNLFIHSAETDLWNVRTDRVESALVHFYPPQGESAYAQAIDIMTPLRISDLPEQADPRFGHRNAEYEAFKQAKADECIRFAESRLPGLRDAIDSLWTSTPLTYQHYTATQEGSAYGVMKDWQSPMTTVLTPRTPIQNLLLTGQSLNLHGVLGTSMTSLFTTAELLGKEKIREIIKK